MLSGYMKGLTRLTIQAPVNSFSLNTWTPTPLILAGLIAGEPARCELNFQYLTNYSFFNVILEQ